VAPPPWSVNCRAEEFNVTGEDDRNPVGTLERRERKLGCRERKVREK